MQHIIRTLVLMTLFIAIAPGAGIEALVARATAVVTGTVATRIERQQEVEFTLNIERVLAGAVPGQSVRVVHSNWASVLSGAMPKTNDDPLRGLWFLVRGPSDVWEVIPSRPSAFRTIHNLYLPISPTPLRSGPFAYGQGAHLLDVLVNEVAGGVVAGKVDPEVLLGALESMDRPSVRQVLRLFLFQMTPIFKSLV